MLKKSIDEFSDQECRMFTELVRIMGEQWYQYMHGERTEPDGPETLMKRTLDFFDGDWIGLIDFDLSMGVWSTEIFYNKETGSTSETLIEDAECGEQALRWIVAIRNNAPIIIDNIEEIKDEAPEEYAMYKRLKTKSVLAVPYRNCGSGLLVIRNPKRFKDNYIALNIFSYIITNELIALRRRESISRKTVNYEPNSYKQVMINLFGDMQIVGKDLTLNRSDIPDAIRFLIAYLALNPGKAVSAERLNDLYGDKVGSWKNLVYRFRVKWKNVRMTENDDYQLIITNDRGYILNPDMEINVDVNNVIELLKTIEDTVDVDAKIEMLRKFMTMYRGEFMQDETMDNYFIEEKRNLYNTTFMAKMDYLLELLYNQRKYDSLIAYSLDILNIYPGSLNTYAWRVSAFRQQGQMDLMKATLNAANSLLDEDEQEMLAEKIESIAKSTILRPIVSVDMETFRTKKGRKKSF